MKHLFLFFIALVVVLFAMFAGTWLFTGTTICPFGPPIDNDGNGIPENCFSSS